MSETNQVNSAVVTWYGQTFMFTLDTSAIQLAKNSAGLATVALEPMGSNDTYHNFLLRLRKAGGGTANE